MNTLISKATKHVRDFGILTGILFWAALLLCPQAAHADEPPAGEPKPRIFYEGVDLVVDPAPEPVPALKYRLLPPVEKQRPGNAAPIYLRLTYETSEEWRKLIGEEPPRLLDLPLDKFPLDEARKFLDRFSDVTEQLSAAGRRTDCNWEYVLEDQDPTQVLLPDVGFMRVHGRLLALKLRCESKGGEFKEALGSLQDGLALGKHVANTPFLVNNLVGIVISNLMLEQVDLFLQQPGAPNLYWAFAALPSPFISLEKALGTEARFLEMKFPELDRLDQPRSEQQWRQLAKELRDWSVEVAKMEPLPEEQIKRIHEPASPSQYEAARGYLRDKNGLPAAQVAAMSEAELEVRYTVALHHELSDRWRKWIYIPTPQIAGQPPEFHKLLREEAIRREWYPLASLTIPWEGNLSRSVQGPQVVLERHRARLQAIEALRMHAAMTGKLPEKLSDVTVVPVPDDPATGEPFRYALENGTATLDLVEATNEQREAVQMPVRIRLRSK